MSSTNQLRIFPVQDDPYHDLREGIDNIFSDNFMIFLTILMLPIILIPIFFDLTEDLLVFLDICDTIIIILFIIEYGAKLYFAKDRLQHFKNIWHILDLIIILLSLIGIMPFFAMSFSGSPSLLLRLIRLPRAIVLSGRTVASRYHTDSHAKNSIPKEAVVEIRVVNQELNKIQEHLTWEQLQQITKDKSQKWIDIHHVSERDFANLSKILSIPEAHFHSKLMNEGYPQIDYLEKASLVFLQSGRILYPEKKRKFLTIEKKGFLIICNGYEIITIARDDSEFFENVIDNVRSHSKGTPLVIEVLYGIIFYIIKKFRTMINELELDLLQIENLHHSEIPSDFLEQTFQIKKELSSLSSNLLHLKEILTYIVNRKVPLEGFTETFKEYFDLLEDEASYLHETAENSKENLLSIIDLFLNRNSYETNKVMRVLAIITSVAVVPAAVSGLLGENLLDMPFGVKLWQILVLVGLGMALVFYIFYKLGWLKS